jgi:hypothetical protein
MMTEGSLRRLLTRLAATPRPPASLASALQPPTSARVETQTMVEVDNKMGYGDGSPMLIDTLVDIEALRQSQNPAAPFRIPPPDWSQLPLKQCRGIVGVAYAEHPIARVRRGAIDLLSEDDSKGATLALVNLLADDDREVRQTAAARLWARDGENGCKFPILALRDEVRGYVQIGSTMTSDNLWLGPEAAVRALDLLEAAAPSEESRATIRQLIEEYVIIEDRIKHVDTTAVKFVGTEEKSGSVYEVYRAKNRGQALAFLKTKRVAEAYYYIEIETPEGNFGRDLKGIYEI